jgi:hypothetical protein
VHVAYAPPSILHSNVAPGSFDEKLKLAEVEFVSEAGFAVIEVSGTVGIALTLKLSMANPSSLSATFVPLQRKRIFPLLLTVTVTVPETAV